MEKYEIEDDKEQILLLKTLYPYSEIFVLSAGEVLLIDEELHTSKCGCVGAWLANRLYWEQTYNDWKWKLSLSGINIKYIRLIKCRNIVCNSPRLVHTTPVFITDRPDRATQS